MNLENPIYAINTVAVIERMNAVLQQQADPFLRSMGEHHFQERGKQIRPKLALALADAFKIEPQYVIGWAAACELFHNGTLIHDDLQDGDTTRRGLDATWKKYGMPQAINLGDILLLAGPLCLEDTPLTDTKKVELYRLYSEMACHVIRGQSQEFQMQNLDNLLEVEPLYKKCIQGKTARLFAAIAEGVALIGSLPHQQTQTIANAFEALGMIFQMQDDILDLFGNKGRDESGCDIKEGKLSILIVEYLKTQPQDHALVKSILCKDRHETSSEDIHRLKDKFIEHKILTSISQEVQNLAQTSLHQLESEVPAATTLYKELVALTLQPISHLEEFRNLGDFVA